MLRLILIIAVVAVCYVRSEEGDSANDRFCKNAVVTAVIVCADKYEKLEKRPNIDHDVFCRLAAELVKCVRRAMVPPNENCVLKETFLAKFTKMIDEFQNQTAKVNC
ncbi:Uncharacterised protein g6435 [Pycnogonum litorale]